MASERDFDQLTHHVIGAAIEVHRHLGPGLLESVYEACLAHQLAADGLPVQRQLPVPVCYKAIVLDDGFRADLIVDGRLLVEVKAVEKVHSVVEAQVLTYLKLLRLRTALLINFNVAVLKDGVRRLSL